MKKIMLTIMLFPALVFGGEYILKDSKGGANTYEPPRFTIGEHEYPTLGIVPHVPEPCKCDEAIKELIDKIDELKKEVEYMSYGRWGPYISRDLDGNWMSGVYCVGTKRYCTEIYGVSDEDQWVY